MTSCRVVVLAVAVAVSAITLVDEGIRLRKNRWNSSLKCLSLQSGKHISPFKTVNKHNNYT